MGYRSEVRIVTTKEGYEQMCDRVDSISKNHDSCQLMGSGRQPEYFEEDGACVAFGWYSIKWHSGFFADVANVLDALDELEESGIPFEFCRVGESWDDIEFRTAGDNDEFTMHVEPSVGIDVF